MPQTAHIERTNFDELGVNTVLTKRKEKGGGEGGREGGWKFTEGGCLGGPDTGQEGGRAKRGGGIPEVRGRQVRGVLYGLHGKGVSSGWKTAGGDPQAWRHVWGVRECCCPHTHVLKPEPPKRLYMQMGPLRK